MDTRATKDHLIGLDLSNGWEEFAPEFIESVQRSTIGVATIQAWSSSLTATATVLDLGCGPGSPRSEVLVQKGFYVYAVDASPTLAAAYKRRFPSAQVVCEPAEDSTFFDRTFDGVLAWGLLFLLPDDVQRGLIKRVARALNPSGRFMFTAPFQRCTWPDLTTGRTSVSLGADAYRSVLADAGLAVLEEHTDEADNHYYEAMKPSSREFDAYESVRVLQ